jgi:hypothetical protein
MAAPHPRLRKHLSAPGLLKTIRQSFEAMSDHRHQRSQISLADALVAGLAVFGLKYPFIRIGARADASAATVIHSSSDTRVSLTESQFW